MREGPFRHRAAPFLRPPLAPRWPVCPVSAAKALGSVAPPRTASVPGPLLPRDHVFHLRHLLGHESRNLFSNTTSTDAKTTWAFMSKFTQVRLCLVSVKIRGLILANQT